MKVLLIQSPRRYWPFLNQDDNFVLPQWMPYIAAALREAGHSVICYDCMALKIGWKSLRKIIAQSKADVIGINESHALYIDESIKLTKLIKDVDRKILVVCGGGHFANMSSSILQQNDTIDYIVRGEGEVTIVDLLDAVENQRPMEDVQGIAFMKGGNYYQSAPRPLVEDLDSLPFPAYDLMPMDQYGKSRYLFSPGGMTIHHSRGCPSNCKFCVWWTQMSDRKLSEGQEQWSPRWRTMSVDRTIKEIEHIKNTYHKECFMFTDGSWNIDPRWSEEFADKLIEKDLRINWFAFMRVDCILRDEKLGVMKKLVDSGLSHLCIGGEHCCQEIMEDFDKKTQNRDTTRECVELLKSKYPQIFLQTTFIVGTKKESKETLKALSQYVKSLKVDFPAFHAFTPVPGSELYETARKEDWLEVKDFQYYDWNTPIISTNTLSREEMEWEFYKLYKDNLRISWLIRGLFSRYPYKRNMYIWWILVAFRVLIASLKERVSPSKQAKRLIVPDWYNS